MLSGCSLRPTRHSCSVGALCASRSVVAIAVVGAALAAPSAIAQHQGADPLDVRTPSALEWARLPEYCAHTQAYHKDGPGYQNWIDRLGFGFSAMHHYCWALIKAHRAEVPGTPKHVRDALLASAIDECSYVLRHTTSDFVLRPEVYLRSGQYAAALEDHARAIEFFEMSIKSKVNYWPPYLEIANVNLSIRRRQHAIDALQRGLSVMPGQEQLTAALSRIQKDSTSGTARRVPASKP